MNYILALVGFVVVVQSVDLDMCYDIAISFRSCCKYGANKTDEIKMKECVLELGEAYLCDYDICYGVKRGYITPNKTINRVALKELLLKEYENNTSILDVVSDKCLGDDINSYMLEDYCYLREIAHCIHLYTMMKCDKWIENDECKKIKYPIQECEKIAP